MANRPKGKTAAKNTGLMKALCFILVILFVAAVIGGGIGWAKAKNLEKQIAAMTPSADDTPGNNDGELVGGLELSEGKNNGISLLTALIPREYYEANNIVTTAETAYTLTATITPEGATNKEVDWFIDWVNSSSTWASGKTVTDYVTVNPTSDGSLTATVQCLQAFGEQIIVTVTSRNNEEKNATVTLDYRERVTDVNLMLSAYGNDYLINEYYSFPFDVPFTPKVELIKSDYTIPSDFTTEVEIGLSSEYLDEFATMFAVELVGGAEYSYVEVTELEGFYYYFDECLYAAVAATSWDYIDENYPDIVYYTRFFCSSTNDMFEFQVIVNEGATFTFGCKIDMSTIVVPVGDLQVNPDGIIF